VCSPDRTAGLETDATRLLPSTAVAPTTSPVTRRAAVVLILLGLAMLPWLIVLHTSLPATAQAAHWALAWTGLDTLEAVGLLSTGLLFRRGDNRACLTAAATAMLLLVDAWFDTMTAARGADLTSAMIMALGAELPLAAACAALAVRTFPRSNQ
jgi:hypothetical protein